MADSLNGRGRGYWLGPGEQVSGARKVRYALYIDMVYMTSQDESRGQNDEMMFP